MSIDTQASDADLIDGPRIGKPWFQRWGVLASGRLDKAAVDEVAAAGDVGGPAGGQEGNQGGDLLWGGEPAGGESADPGDDRLAGVVGVLVRLTSAAF